MTVPDYLPDVANYLASKGVGTAGTDIFLYDFEPRTINCIAIAPITGLECIPTLSGDAVLYRPELSVRVRNSSPHLCEQKATEVYNTLNLLINTTYGSTYFKRIEALSDPFFLSKDGNNGTIYAINFILYVE